MTPLWDPQRYLAYAGERGRPYVELLARIPEQDARRVVDLGCGPGNLTALLAERWPRATVVGVDSSAEMIDRARRDVPGIDVELRDLRAWVADPGAPVDVLVSNATLQWVPDHLDLLAALVATVAPGGVLAFQVPGNFDEPSHALRAALAAEEPYAAHTTGVVGPAAHDAATYLDRLSRLGCEVDAWETTYLHVLDSTDDPDPVFTWISGTGARPTLQALPPGLRERFEAELKRRLRVAYPDTGPGVVLPFRRVFVVARRPTVEETR